MKSWSKLFVRFWAIFFLAVFGTNLSVLFSASSQIAWAEERSDIKEDTGDRETKSEDAPTELKVEDAPTELKVEDAPTELKVEDDWLYNERKPEEPLFGDIKVDDLFIPPAPGVESEMYKSEGLKFTLEPTTEEKVRENLVKIDGEEIVVVETMVTTTDYFGRTVTSTTSEYVDPKTGSLVFLETQDEFLKASIDDLSIVESFDSTYRESVAQSLLGGEPTEFRDMLIASLTDAEKDFLFSTETFGQKTSAATNFDFGQIEETLELRPDANFSIGASGDDDLVVPFEPLASEKSVQAVTEIAVSATVAAGSATAAAVGAASVGSGGAGIGAGSPGPSSPAAPSAPAPGNPSTSPSRQGGSSPQSPSPGSPKAGGTGAGGGGGGSLDGEAGSVENANEDVYDALAVAEYDVGSYNVRRTGRFERWFGAQRWMRLFESFDALFQGIQASLRKFPLLHNMLDDSSSLRTISGPLYVALPIAGVLTGVFGAMGNSQGILHPPIEIYLLLMVIGVLDTASGLVGAVVFLGLSSQVFDFLNIADYRTAFGFLMSCIGPALIARAVVGFRRARTPTPLSRLRDVTDVALSMVIGGWIASIMVRALPSLSGLSLPAANHVDTTHLIVSAAFALRLALEIFAARLLPGRTAHVRTEPVVSGSVSGSLVWAVGRIGLTFMLSSAFLGTGWESWVVTIVIGAPHLVSIFNQRLPRLEALWKVFPYGAFSFATILALEVGLETVVARFAAGLDFSTIFMLCLAPLTAVFAIAQMLAQPKDESRVHWWERVPSVSVRAAASIALILSVFFVTRLL
ncbi:hypothetical protein N9M74_00960 [Pontimonas sp.]|nr:hypothetical protein [Pontimonas sp.]